MPPMLLWDASALAKHYTQETGSETVQALFAQVPLAQMVTTVWGYAETFYILLRRRNSGIISLASFAKAISALQAEIIDTADFGLLTVDDAAVFAGISRMQKHNLNTSDAAILALFLRYVHGQPLIAVSCVLVAADKRLVRAARAEGLTAVDPETSPAADVPAFLASL